jgi:hypothetical protein
MKKKLTGRKPKPVQRQKLTPDVFEEIRHHVPSLAEVEFDGLLYPEQKAFAYTSAKRKAMLESQPDHWTTKLTLKLDRLEFPELTAGENYLTEGKKLARLIVHKQAVLPTDKFERLTHGRIGEIISKKFMQALWRFDSVFFQDFAKGLKPFTLTTRVYLFLLRNRAAVENCKRICEIQKLPGMPKYEATSFCRLCKSVGLPVKVRPS